MNTDHDFLQAILADPDDGTLRLVYADWLEEQGDARAEFLRLQAQAEELPAIPKDQPRRIARALRARMRLEDLTRQVDSGWQAVLDRVPIENCSVRFAFQCPRQWQGLQTTKKAGVRFCEACRKNVYYCETVEQARTLARKGYCVAVQSHVDRAPNDLRLEEEEQFAMGVLLPPDDEPADDSEHPWWRIW